MKVGWRFVVFSFLIVSTMLAAACAKPSPAPAPTSAPTATPAPAPSPTPTPVKPIAWKLDSQYPVGHFHLTYIQKFADEVKKRTNGRLDITVYPAGSVGLTGAAVVQAIREGFVQMGGNERASFAGEIPLGTFLNMPFITTTVEENRKVELATRPFIEKELADKTNTFLVFSYPFTPAHLFASFRAPTVKDWTGKKIRSFGPESDQLVRLAGGTPVSMPLSDVYMAISKGTVEGILTAVLNIKPFKLYEVAKYGNNIPWFIAAQSMTVNRDAFNALPADIKAILTTVGKEIEEEEWRAIPGVENAFMAELPPLGVEIVQIPKAEVDKFVSMSAGIWDDWAKRNAPAGPQMLDAAKKALGR